MAEILSPASGIPRLSFSHPYTRPLTRLITLYRHGVRLAKRTVLIVSLAITGCRSQLLPASPTPEIGTLRLLADSSTAPLLRDLVRQYRPAHLLISWDIDVVEPLTIRHLLESGQAEFAITSVVPVAALESGSLWATPIGQDGVALVVHPDNPLRELTPAQVRAIWQGRISDWAELDSAASGTSALNAITVVTQPSGSASALTFQNIALGDRKITAAARLAPDDQAVINIVAATPGAVGYVSVGYVDDRVRAVALDGILPAPHSLRDGAYPLRSPILFVGRDAPGNDAYRDFFAWVQSPAGQAVVRRQHGGLN